VSAAPGMPLAPELSPDGSPEFAAEVIDLRGPEPSWASTATPAVEPAPDEPGHRLRHRRRWIVAGLLAIVGLILLDVVLGLVVHDQRQRHLAFDVTQSKTSVEPGEALMVLQIPQIGLNTVVIEGATSSDLRSGPGHVVGSAYPNGVGNIVVLAHRTRYEGPFGDLSTVVKGSQVAIQMRSGLIRNYSVSDVRTVAASDRSALAASDAEQLTLVTSGPGWRPDQLVVLTATPDGPVVGTASETEYHPDAGALDARLAGGALSVLIVGVVLALMGAAVIFGGRELRRRYTPLTTFGVLLPVVGLLVIVCIYAVDGVMPFLY